jgi:biotin carboxyl carrier protein
MKKIMITALVFAAFATARAQTPATAPAAAQSKPRTETSAKEQTPAPAAKEGTAAATDDSAGYVGTNDFYLALVREGIRRA